MKRMMLAGVLVFVLAVVAGPLSCLAVLTAPLHSPGLMEEALCPEGTKLESGSRKAGANRAGERIVTATCVDADGKPKPRRDLDERALLAGIKIYYPICAIGLLVLASPLVLLLFVLRRPRR